MGHHRLLAHVRDVPHHRRPPRRHVRPPPDVHRRRRDLRARLVPRIRVALGPGSRARRGDHRRSGRVAAHPGDALDPVDDVPGRGTRGRVRGLGNGRGRVGRVRSARRGIPDDELLVALGVADQRDRSSVVRRRRAVAHATRCAARAPARHRRSRRGDDRDGFVRARVRAERGGDLRHVPAAARLLGRGPVGVARVAAGVDRARRVRGRARDPRGLRRVRARQGTA